MRNVSAGLLTGSTDLRNVWADLLTGSTDFAVPPPICETCRPTRLRQTSQIGAGSGFRAIRFDERLGHLVQQIGAGSGFYAIRFDERLGQLVQQCASSTNICQICQHRRQVSRDIRQIRKRCVQVSRDICRNNQADMQISPDICRICRPISHMHATSA